MKYHSIPHLVLTATLLAVGAFNLSAADWGSLHGNNHSAPSAPVFHPQPEPSRAPAMHQETVRPPEPRREVQPVREQTRQEVRPLEPRREVQPVREQTRQEVRPEVRFPSRPVAVERTRAGEVNRRRMDIDEDRRQSYFWSDYHAGMRIDRLPDGYRRFRLHDHDFFFFGGVYYDSGPAGYVVCAPPVGADIPGLPPGTETIQVGDTIYYYAAGAFYIQQPDGSFVVVAAPLGVTVALLPPDASSVVINGMVYYQADGVYYQPVLQNGVTAYLTIPPP